MWEQSYWKGAGQAEPVIGVPTAQASPKPITRDSKALCPLVDVPHHLVLPSAPLWTTQPIGEKLSLHKVLIETGKDTPSSGSGTHTCSSSPQVHWPGHNTAEALGEKTKRGPFCERPGPTQPFHEAYRRELGPREGGWRTEDSQRNWATLPQQSPCDLTQKERFLSSGAPSHCQHLPDFPTLPPTHPFTHTSPYLPI